MSSLLLQSQAKYHILSNNINNCTSNLSLLLNRVPLMSFSSLLTMACFPHSAPNTLSLCLCSVMSNSVTPQTVTCQAPLSMGFSRQKYWSGLPFPFSGDLPDPGIESRSPSPALQEDSLATESTVSKTDGCQPVARIGAVTTTHF